MAATVAPLPALRLPSAPSPITAEQRYWKSFRNTHRIESPSGAPITHISYAPPPPPSHALLAAAPSSSTVSDDVFAVTAGTRVQIYSARTCKLEKTLTRFGDLARSAVVRPRGGGIVAAGDDQGLVQVFDLGSRAILRSWAAHKPQPVWAVRWSPVSATTLLSAGDDRAVRLWDLPANEPLVTLRGHDDYVRSAAFVPGTRTGENVFVTGSYDATVRLWDSRVRQSVMVFKHAAPVETVLPMPSGTTVLATAGNAITVLDLVAARPMNLVANHQKTVTSLSLASGGTRVVSGGLDGHVKIFETMSWNVVYGAKFPSPVLAVQVIGGGSDGFSSSSSSSTPADDSQILSDRHLIVGTHSGLLSIKTRLTGAAATRARERAKEMDALLAGRADSLDKSKAKRKRRADANKRLDLVGEGADVVIANHHLPHRSAARERPWHRDLRRGRYPAALDRVLDKSSPTHAGPVDVLSLLVALRHRSAMRDALEGRDESTVLPVLRWLCAHIADPRYLGVCVEAALHLFDLYAEHVAGSVELNLAFQTLHRRVKAEVEKAQVACETNGMLESLILATAE